MYFTLVTEKQCSFKTTQSTTVSRYVIQLPKQLVFVNRLGKQNVTLYTFLQWMALFLNQKCFRFSFVFKLQINMHREYSFKVNGAIKQTDNVDNPTLSKDVQGQPLP